MSIKTKAILLGLLLLSLLSAGLTAGMIYQLKHNTAAELATYRDGEMEEVEARLKSLVDIAYASLEAGHRNLRDPRFVERYYGHRLRNVVDITEAVVHDYMQQAAAGQLSVAEAQARALADIKKMRYDGGTGYVWVNDTTRPHPHMLMHPTVPALEGKRMDNPKYDAIALQGTTNLFTAFLDVCAQHGEGFVDYRWPKPTPAGLVADVPKLSYVRLIPEWNWIVGTGIYMDDAERELLEKIKIDLRKMRYDNGAGYFWINNTDTPQPSMIMHPLDPALEGLPMQDEIYQQAYPGIGLGAAFVQAVAQSGEGYVEYRWPKPIAENITRPQLKLSYLKLYEPLGWIIGTGVYIDEIDREIAAKQQALTNQINTLIHKMLLFTASLFILVILVLWLLLSRMLAPLERVSRELQILAEGRITEDSVTYRGRDEIAGIIQAFVRLREKIRATIAQARAIAGGDLSLSIRDIARHDQLGVALADMTLALHAATEKNLLQNWLKSGQTHLHECMRGEQSLTTLAENIIECLSTYLKAPTGLFYLFSGEGEAGSLTLLASYGFERRTRLANQVRPGEALVGQAALEKKLIILSCIQTEVSFLTTPYTIALPFFYENHLKGVIELGSAEEFSGVQIEFLKVVMQDIGIAVNSAQFRAAVHPNP